MTQLIKDKSGENTVSLVNLEYLKQVFKEGFTETTSGNFGPALSAYQKCIQHAAVSLALNADEEEEIKRLVNNCVEYIIAMRIELKRRDKAVTTTEQDNLLLAMLMSVCKLHPSHSFLVLNNAMN
jgi:Coatomer (COPI) alpha subunit C-terminus